MITGALVGGKLADVLRLKLIERNGGKSVPEFRLYATFPAMILIPLGYLWYGWSLTANANFVVPLIGLFFSGTGTMVRLHSSSRLEAVVW